MNIENLHLLKDFSKRHARAEKPLQRWRQTAAEADWKSFADVRVAFPSTDMVKPHRLIFDIKGNDYRLIVRAFFVAGTLVIEGVYTHAEYDRLNLR